MWEYHDIKTNKWIPDTYDNIIAKFKGFIGPEMRRIK